MDDANALVRELVRQRVPTMDHVELLMRLYEANKPLPVSELIRASRLTPKTVERVAADLTRARLVSHDPVANTFAYATAAENQPSVHALAAMYNQKPVTLVKLVYAQPPSALQSFADAFRIVNDKPRDE